MPAYSHPASRLTADALHAGYDAKRILQGVDIAVAEGQLTVLLGPNGSGKSTLLKTLARTLTPSGGHVYLDGKDIHRSNTREVAQRLGFPHQGFWKKDPQQDANAIAEAMAYMHVTEFADRDVEALSGGQRQRCWIAMVLAQQTDLILLDEPTTFLDESRRRLRRPPSHDARRANRHQRHAKRCVHRGQPKARLRLGCSHSARPR